MMNVNLNKEGFASFIGGGKEAGYGEKKCSFTLTKKEGR